MWLVWSSTVVTPRPGVSPQTVLEALRETETAVGNARGAGGSALDQFNRYHLWADEAANRLGRLLRPDDVDDLVTTRRHWTLQSLDPASRASGALATFVGLEFDERVRDFELARRDLEAQLARWNSRSGLFVIADTNVYLHHEDYFDEIAWNSVVPALAEGVHLIVPLVVVDELDRHKRTARNVTVSSTSIEQVRTRARLSLRRLDDLLPDPAWLATVQPDRFPDAGPVTVEFLLDDRRHVRLPDADTELVDRAVGLQDVSGRKVHIVTFDTGMSVRARAAHLEVVKLKEV